MSTREDFDLLGLTNTIIAKLSEHSCVPVPHITGDLPLENLFLNTGGLKAEAIESIGSVLQVETTLHEGVSVSGLIRHFAESLTSQGRFIESRARIAL